MLTVNGRSIQRGLQIHPKNPKIQEELQRPLILGIPSLGAKRQERLVVTGDKGGREGGARALMGGQCIRAIGVKIEHLAACAERKTKSFNHW